MTTSATPGQTASASASGEAPSQPVGVHPFAPFLDVEFNVTVVLGYANVPLRGLLELRPESTIELDRAAKAPVDVLVNEKLFARGEMVVVDDGQIGVRVREILGTEPPKAGTQ